MRPGGGAPPPRPAPADLLFAVLGRRATLPPGDLGAPEWDALAEAAARRGVMPLLLRRLQERDADRFAPAAVRRRLDESHTVAALRAQASRRQLDEALTALQARDVPVVLLKGAYLAAHAYPSAAVRPMGDLDLLVPEDRLAPAMDALAAVGYAHPSAQEWDAFRNHRHPPPMRRPGRLPIELHLTIEPCAPPFALPLADVWARTRPVPTSGARPLTLAPEDLLLHLATHMGHSHLLGTSLVRVYDGAMWIERFGGAADWDALVRRAIASGTRRFVYAMLELTRRLLACEVPREVLRALRAETDDAAADAAVALLRLPPELLVGATVLVHPSATRWVRTKRVARSFLLTSELLRGTSLPEVRRALDHPSRRARLRARARALVRLLIHPGALRAAVQQASRVDRLARWTGRSAAADVARPRRTGQADPPPGSPAGAVPAEGKAVARR